MKVPYGGTLLILAWVTAIFWITDIGVNFFTGYYESGVFWRLSFCANGCHSAVVNCIRCAQWSVRASGSKPVIKSCNAV
eukprot:5111948-Amphidinium_carterae.1